MSDEDKWMRLGVPVRNREARLSIIVERSVVEVVFEIPSPQAPGIAFLRQKTSPLVDGKGKEEREEREDHDDWRKSKLNLDWRVSAIDEPGEIEIPAGPNHVVYLLREDLETMAEALKAHVKELRVEKGDG